jgi:hypothetical protein
MLLEWKRAKLGQIGLQIFYGNCDLNSVDVVNLGVKHAFGQGECHQWITGENI